MGVEKIATQLFLVEGPPYAGKNEAAQYIADTLSADGLTVSMYTENETEHPAEYAFHAHMTEDQIATLTEDERRQLYAESMKVATGYIIPLTKISVSLFGKVLPYKIYDKLDWETEYPVILQRWRSFTETAMHGGGSYVFVGSLLKNLVGETMMRYDFPGSDIQTHVQDIYQLIAPLDPVLVFMGSDSIASCIDTGSMGRKAAWLTTAIANYTGQSYARHRGLSGFGGYIECLHARQEMELDILSRLPLRKLVLMDAGEDWESAYDAIGAFITGKTLQTNT